jgi:hypothetical protein
MAKYLRVVVADSRSQKCNESQSKAERGYDKHSSQENDVLTHVIGTQHPKILRSAY